MGLGLASTVARLTGLRTSRRLVVGAIIAGNLPDFDWIPVLLGVPTRRVHRQATHALPILATLVALAAWVEWQLSPLLDPRVVAAWSVALISHPLLDLITTSSVAAQNGFGIPIFWPLSSKRWAVRQDIFQTPGLRGYRSPGRTLKAVVREVAILGTVVVLLILGVQLLRCEPKGHGGKLYPCE